MRGHHNVKNRLLVILFAFYLSELLYSQITLDYQIEGIKEPALSNVIKTLDMRLKPYATKLTPSRIQQLYFSNEDAIKDALKAYGYFKPIIYKSLHEEGNKWRAHYNIEPGPILTVTELDLQIIGDGAHDPVFQNFVKNFPLVEGMPLWTEHYDEAKQTLFRIASERGYLDAVFTTHRIDIDWLSYTAIVTLHFNTHQRYRFGPVTFSDTTLSDKLLRRFIPFIEKEHYTQQQVMQLQRGLVNSNYFKQVFLQPKVDETIDDIIPMEANLVMNKPHQYRLGGGFGTDTGVRGLVGWEWRYANTYGHSISTLLQASQINTEINFLYTIPGRYPLTDRYQLNAGYEVEYPARGLSRISRLGAAHIKDWRGWQQTLALRYQQEWYKLENENPMNLSHLLMPSVTWQRTTGDGPTYITQGHRLIYNIRGGWDQALSDTSFLQFNFKGKLIYPLTQRTRFITRAELGYTVMSDIDELPRSVRFFTGGAQNVRGYGYESLGPGRYLIEGSVELQQQLFFENWYLALFYDAGNAFDRFERGNNSWQRFHRTMARSVGTGLVWQSPVGAMALTIAKPVAAHTDGIRIQFSMGPEL